MIHPGDEILVGLSGGADSIALTDLLIRLGKEWKLTIHAVHVNHGIRGEEAMRDELFCRDFCAERGVQFHLFSYSVPELAVSAKEGVEETGRKCRKKAFQSVREELKGDRVRIALAHNENDVAETVLHHLARGTGLRGMAGILPVSGDIIRPILCLTRKEVEAYCLERGLSYVTDSTNLEDHYTRNRIRHQILPLLEQEVNPKVIIHLAETALQAAEAENYLREQAARLLEKQKKEENSILFLEAFRMEPEILQRYAVLDAMELLSGERKDLGAGHVKDILHLWEKETSSEVHLPYGLKAKKVYGGLLLEKKSGNSSAYKNLQQEVPLEKGEVLWGNGAFYTDIFPWNGEEIAEKKYTKWFDYDKIKGSLVIRTRKEGDHLTMNQAGQTKKLNRYFIDAKVPLAERDRVPLLALDTEILWVTGGRISEKYKIDSSTKKVLQIMYKGEWENE
ncbi:MAG: tRNA lysidine(34) synthetase TilS [Clostridiales bacterium]|nr:tRNA lysidine(34) synthetase TilS [Candidatus Blautia equi]